MCVPTTKEVATDAAPPKKSLRRIVALLAVLGSCTIFVASPGASASSRSWQPLWPVVLSWPGQVERGSLPGLHRAGIDALVVTRDHWTERAHRRLLDAAQAAGQIVIEPRRVPVNASDRAALKSACSLSGGTLRRCAISASSVGAALRLARSNLADFVVVGVRSPQEIAALRPNSSRTTRIIAVVRWTGKALLDPSVWVPALQAAWRDPATSIGLSVSTTAPTRLAPYTSLVAAAVARTEKAADVTPPTPPSNVRVVANTANSVTIQWDPASDNVGVARYLVTVDGGAASDVTGVSTTIGSLPCGTTHAVAVGAADAASNVSATATLSVATLSCPASGGGGSAGGGGSGGGGSSGGGSGTGGGSGSGGGGSGSGGGSGGGGTGGGGSGSGAGGYKGGPIYLAPSGADANSCSQTAPCRTFDYAYRSAQPGDTVNLLGGTYPSQTIGYSASKAGATQRVVFAPAPGATVAVSGTLTVQAQHLELRDLQANDIYAGTNSNVPVTQQAGDLVFTNLTLSGLVGRGLQGLTWRGGSVGGVTNAAAGDVQLSDCYQCSYVSRDITIDGVYFHDVVRDQTGASQGIHTECLHFWGGIAYVTVRNSRFYNCAIMDMFVENYATGSSGNVHDFVVENNFFDVPGSHGGATSQSSASLLFETQNRGNISNITARFNTLYGQLVFSENGGVFVNSSAVGNYGGDTACTGKQVSYQYNLWTSATCGGTDKKAAFKVVNQGSGDLHLAAGAPALNAVPVSVGCPASDIDGQARPQGGACDAGADEAG